jgi:hypothetical protein
VQIKERSFSSAALFGKVCYASFCSPKRRMKSGSSQILPAILIVKDKVLTSSMTLMNLVSKFD